MPNTSFTTYKTKGYSDVLRLEFSNSRIKQQNNRLAHKSLP